MTSLAVNIVRTVDCCALIPFKEKSVQKKYISSVSSARKTQKTMSEINSLPQQAEKRKNVRAVHFDNNSVRRHGMRVLAVLLVILCAISAHWHLATVFLRRLIQEQNIDHQNTSSFET